MLKIKNIKQLLLWSVILKWSANIRRVVSWTSNFKITSEFLSHTLFVFICSMLNNSYPPGALKQPQIHLHSIQTIILAVPLHPLLPLPLRLFPHTPQTKYHHYGIVLFCYPLLLFTNIGLGRTIVSFKPSPICTAFTSLSQPPHN